MHAYIVWVCKVKFRFYSRFSFCAAARGARADALLNKGEHVERHNEGHEEAWDLA